MLQARYKNKSQSEDLKTSSILGSLLLLPDDLLWELLVKSCCGGTEKLPDVAGVLDSFEFWPRWNADNTTNLKYVEPDLFLRFSNFDVIVEVKQFDGNGQYYEQWENEICSYFNEYGSVKDVYFIALGGNGNKKPSIVRSVPVYRCSWLSLLASVSGCLDRLDRIDDADCHTSSCRRILGNVMLSFKLNGMFYLEWFDSFVVKEEICRDSINVIKYSIFSLPLI